ncbi:replication protein A 70 kDa DNA-binding subunit B-like protein isoform X2 [Tanacetum coccineum]
MSRPISNVADIRLGPKKPWTVIVQVLENNHVQQSESGKDYKKLIFTDSQGMKLSALIYEADLRYFNKLLTQYKRYHVSNDVVTRNDPVFRVSSYQYSWILTNKTVVEELVEAVPPTIPCQFEFTSFSDLYKYAESDSYHNKSGFGDRPYDIWHEAQSDNIQLYNENKLELRQMLEKGDYKNSDMLLAYPKEEDIVSLATAYKTAEKIMPFTALQLGESGEMGIDLFEDIATSLQQHTVVAALIRTLPGRGQINEPSTNVNTPAAITTPSKSRASTLAVDAVDKGKEQLFTPFTKLVLEEINSNIASNHVKRSLPFSDDHLPTKTVSAGGQPEAKATLIAVKKEFGDRLTKGSLTKKLKD